jgi:hypothetical protein
LTQQASCLANIPGSSNSTVFTNNILPGQFITADDQCKQIYGSTASFCHVKEFLFYFF